MSRGLCLRIDDGSRDRRRLDCFGLHRPRPGFLIPGLRLARDDQNAIPLKACSRITRSGFANAS